MNVTDLVYIDATGYHYADYPTFQTWLQDQYKAIYGQDVYLGADSQDGQFLAILAQAYFDTAALGASVYNSFSPATAQGAGLARVVKINGLRKRVATYSTVTLTVVGTAGTVVTNGIAQDTLGQQWALPTTVTIPGGGTINVVATATEIGALTADIGTVTVIFTPTLGWQTVNNAAGATPGAPIETDAQLRVRQAQSTSLPAQTVIDATGGAIANLTGVTASRMYENVTDTTDGNGLPEHSICAVVAGGNAVEICQTILDYKTPGANTYGATTETVYDAKGMPSSISYQPAITAEIGVTISITAGVGFSSDYNALIQNAVADVVNAFQIGGVVLYTTLFGAAYLNGAPEGKTYIVNSIQIKKNAGSFSAANIVLAFDEQPVCNPSTDVIIT